MSTEKPEQQPEHEQEHEKKHHPLLEMFNADGMIEHPADPEPEGPNDVPLGSPYAS
jgi:hypothetical protein